MPSAPAHLADVVDVARPIVERIVWSSVATVGPDGGPRSRLLHPVWTWDGDVPTALVAVRRTPVKVAHLDARPEVSCFYWDPRHDTVAIDAWAAWVPGEDVADAWDRVAATPEPAGFDPAMIWPDGPTDPGCAFLRLRAHRIVATPAGRPGLRWRSDRGDLIR